MLDLFFFFFWLDSPYSCHPVAWYLWLKEECSKAHGNKRLPSLGASWPGIPIADIVQPLGLPQ